jgi:hypothetical protein
MNPSSSRGGHFYLLALGVFAAAAYQTARAEEPLRIPGADVSVPGVLQKSSIPTPEISSAGLADLSGAEALTMQFKDSVPLAPLPDVESRESSQRPCDVGMIGT